MEWLKSRESSDDVATFPHVGCWQETRLANASAIATAAGWCATRGTQMHFQAAEVIGDGPWDTSAGTAIGAVRGDPFEPIVYDFGDLRHRITAVKVGANLMGGLVVISAYFLTGGLSAFNVAMLEALGAFIATINVLWVLAADWNMQPQVLHDLHWLEVIRGSVVKHGAPTCGQNVFDYFGVSSLLMHYPITCSSIDDAPVSPHTPALLRIEGVGSDRFVPIVKPICKFPSRPVVGPSNLYLAKTWSWTLGSIDTLQLKPAMDEWFTQVEDFACHDFGISDEDSGKYTGRAGGFGLTTAAVSKLAQRGWHDKHSNVTHAWRGLMAMARHSAHLATNVANGGKSMARLRKITNKMSLLPLEWEAKAETIGGSLRIFVQRLCHSCATVRANATQQLQVALKTLMDTDAKASLAAWKVFATNSTQRGSAIAHKFSKGPKRVQQPICIPDSLATKPVFGKEAVFALLVE